MQTDLKIGGKYQHYKGNFYRVIAVAKHSETLEELVIYETLYDNPHSKIWARPKAMFCETLTKNGKTMQRFALVEE